MSRSAWDDWQDRLFGRVEALALGETALDEATRRRAALVLVDDLAAMVFALDEPTVRALGDAAVRCAPQAEATQVTGRRSGRAWTALVNAVAANWNELDEGYRPATCHGGLYALPAAMAEVEAEQGTLGDLLRALVAGYEVSTSYARVLPATRPFALHPHATMAPVGAAAAVAAARGASGPGVREAAQVAITLAAAGPFDHAMKGLLVRNAWAGHGAMAGFTAVELAAAGIGGDASSARGVLERGLGFPLDEQEAATERDAWTIHDGYHKSYACCQYSHSAVEATLDLVAGQLAGVDVADIASVLIDANPLAITLDETNPRSVLGAKFSLPHCVAAVLVRGDADAEAFSERYVDDPAVVALRAKIRIQPYEGDLAPPYDRPARITVTTTSGEVLVQECRSALGGPDRPLSDAAVLDKAEALTAARRPAFPDLARRLVDGTLDDRTPWSDVIAELWAP